MIPQRILPCLFLVITCVVRPLLADIVNRTIDDTFGDSQTGLKVTYLPPLEWHDQTCAGCALYISPNVSDTFRGTFTAATYHPSDPTNITMHFNGTAIYVFFVLVNAGLRSGVTILTVANFTLDENDSVQFGHVPDPTAAMYQYNQLVFRQTSLLNTQHTLIISTSGGVGAYVNFDYAIYSYDDGDTALPSTPISNTTLLPTTKSVYTTSTAAPAPTNGFLFAKTQLSTGTIVGAAVAVIAIVFSTFLLVLYLKRRQHRSRNEKAEEEEVVRIRPFGPDLRTLHPQTNTVRIPYIERLEPPISTTLASSEIDKRDGHEIGQQLQDQVACDSAFQRRLVVQVHRFSGSSLPEYASYTDSETIIHHT